MLSHAWPNKLHHYNIHCLTIPQEKHTKRRWCCSQSLQPKNSTKEWLTSIMHWYALAVWGNTMTTYTQTVYPWKRTRKYIIKGMETLSKKWKWSEVEWRAFISPNVQHVYVSVSTDRQSLKPSLWNVNWFTDICTLSFCGTKHLDAQGGEELLETCFSQQPLTGMTATKCWQGA